MAAIRINDSLLSRVEREALAFLVLRIPTNVAPDHLTHIGLAGALVTAAGFLGCWVSNWLLIAVVLGLFLNWFGDSLDGTLARYRQIERPHYGYFIDHSADLIAQTLIVVGLGFSPFFTVPSSLLVLSLYLLMSSYTYLRVVTESVHRLSYGGMGATEFRILVAVWALLAAWLGPGVLSARFFSIATLDLVIGLLSACTFFAFLVIIRNDLVRMQRTESLDEKTETPVGDESRLELPSTEFAEHIIVFPPAALARHRTKR